MVTRVMSSQVDRPDPSPSSPFAAQAFMKFSDSSVTTFHCVQTMSLYLESSGFIRLYETELWDLKPGHRYFFVRNDSAIIAFALGGKWESGQGINLIGAHADSCSLKLKPNPMTNKEGYISAHVEPYGGGLWHTWFDRDLGLAGRVIVADDNDILTTKLVRFDKSMGRVPTLAIHLDRSVMEGFKFNKEDQLVPLMGTLNDRDPTKSKSVLLEILAEKLGVPSERIRDFELNFFDLQTATLGGIDDEFVFAGRIDNQMSCFAGTLALVEACEDKKFSTSNKAWAFAAFDNEEIGSQSYAGALSDLIPTLVERLTPRPELKAVCLAKSFLLSCDTAHAVHPNYGSQHAEGLKPLLNKGVVLKTSHNLRYTTNAATSSATKQFAAKGGCKPLQEFAVRNDCPCGSTIGPLVSKFGIQAVDVGLAQLSMHSIREMCGAHDIEEYVKFMRSFFIYHTQ